MPLQNRVTPDMQIVRQNWRGDFMGNRGGRIHDPITKTLLKRKWASRRWIICVTEFKQRQRVVMGNSYTELFFLDEVSALAAGHRPCFECRREAANAFGEAWKSAYGKPDGSLADAMDTQLHKQRLGKNILLDKEQLERLPDGAIVKIESTCFAKKNASFYQWSGASYSKAKLPEGEVYLQTPLSIVEVLSQGYLPLWHRSAS
jgi:hypothetical protein